MNIAYILSEGNTATTDYFLLPYLLSQGYQPKVLDTADGIDAATQSRGGMVVISRYLPPRLRDTLLALKQQGMKVVYFMDDDLFDMGALASLPWKYRLKIIRGAILQQAWLRAMWDEFWVSTPYLAQKYALDQPKVIQPHPSAELLGCNERRISFCYHATSSHRRELDWLVSVVAKVQRLSGNTHFEVFGGRDVVRRYRKIPRVSVIHPMRWPEYLSWSSGMRRDIALAPLLSNSFNAARGATKFYDYARLGAAGIYTNVPPYQGFVRHGEDGLLLNNDPDEWVATILKLATDQPLRNRLALTAKRRAFTHQENKQALGDAAVSYATDVQADSSSNGLAVLGL